MKKIELLQILSEKVAGCIKCPELVANRTQVVFGEGNPNAKILFLGEASGQTEDELGRPFVGRAGQLLNNIIKSCGWLREDVFITNVCLCRPPNNRTPKEDEAKNCETYLKLQIKIVNPKFIVCLGATAARNLLKVDHPIGFMRGRWFKYEDAHVNADVICTYHPSYLLRNPKAKEDVWEDLQILIEKIK
jgi:DNA polymerase